MQLSEFFPSNLPVHIHPPYFKLLHGLTLIHNTQRPCIKRHRKLTFQNPSFGSQNAPPKTLESLVLCASLKEKISRRHPMQ
jgi:hypothetical protein